MNIAELKKLQQKQQEQHQQQAQRNTESQMPSMRDVFGADNTKALRRCKRCNNTIDFYMVQTRSADEGATTFWRCTTCNITFR